MSRQNKNLQIVTLVSDDYYHFYSHNVIEAMSITQTRPSRFASQLAIEKNQEILNQNDIVEIDDSEELLDAKKVVTKNKRSGGKAKSTNIIPIVTQNSKKYDLNYFKQFCKKLEQIPKLNCMEMQKGGCSLT